MVAEFRLKPNENIMGVRYDGGALRLRPTLAAEALDLYGIVVTILVGVIAVATKNVVVGIAVIPMLAMSCRYLACRVTAADDTVTVVNKWNRRPVRADEITDVRLETFRPGWGFLPFAGPTTLWPRTFKACVLILRSGEQVRVDALVGLPRSKDDPIESPLETKVAILQRWIETPKR